MVLYKLDEYYTDCKDIFGGYDIKKFDVYAEHNDKVGSVKNILIDNETERFRYFIVDTGFWFTGKQVLLPVGFAQIDFEDQRVLVPGLTKQQVEDLVEFTEDLKIDDDYEDRVRGVYSPLMPIAGIGGMGYPLLGTSLYDRYPNYYSASGNFRDYEDQYLERRKNRPPV